LLFYSRSLRSRHEQERPSSSKEALLCCHDPLLLEGRYYHNKGHQYQGHFLIVSHFPCPTLLQEMKKLDPRNNRRNNEKKCQ
jgi:hypothetical protein